MLLTLLAFLCAIAVLVAVHEWGHFAVARLCGVKVLTFSIGFGPRLMGWTSARTGTQFQLGLLPWAASSGCWMSARPRLRL